MFNATIVGRLGNDPEIRYTEKGVAVTNFPVAHNWVFHEEKLVKWVKCSAWGEIADKANEELRKGDLAQVSGPVTFRTWRRDDGVSVEDVVLRVDTFEKVNALVPNAATEADGKLE